MYCSQCGKEISESSKFCNECGSPVVEKKEPHFATTNNKSTDIYSTTKNIEQKEVGAQTGETVHKNTDAKDKENISAPKLSNAFWVCGIIVSLCFLYLQATISSLADIFHLGVILVILIFVVCALVCFGTIYVFISDYKLSKKDFEQYKIRVQENKKFEESLKEMQKIREMNEQKKQEGLNAKRAEYRAKGIPTCPKCGSPSIATINRGYSLVSGFIGSGKPVNVCQICGHKWQIGK